MKNRTLQLHAIRGTETMVVSILDAREKPLARMQVERGPITEALSQLLTEDWRRSGLVVPPSGGK
jgi:hypothetical protein